MKYGLLCLLLVACAPKAPVPATAPQAARPPVAGSPLLMAVLASPDVANAYFSIKAAEHERDAIAASNRVQLGLGGGAGINHDDTADTEVAAVATLSASKVLNDGGRHQAELEGATVSIQIATLAHALAGDEILYNLVSSAMTYSAANQSIAEIDKALEAYATREHLIAASYANGVLTNSTMFDIDAAVLAARQNRLDLALQRDLARAEIDRYLPAKAAQDDLFRRLRDGNAERAPQWRIDMLVLEETLTGTSRDAVLSRSKPQSRLVGNLSNDDDELNAYVGVRVDFNLYDGGQTKAAAEALAAQKDAQHYQIQGLQEALDAGTRLTQITSQKTAQRRKLLLDRKSQSARRLTEMEQLMRAGRADIGAIAREVIAQAETNIALINTDTQRQMATLNLLRTKGGVCDFVAMCDSLLNVE